MCLRPSVTALRIALQAGRAGWSTEVKQGQAQCPGCCAHATGAGLPPLHQQHCACGSSLRSKQAPTGQPLSKPFSGSEGRSSFQGGVHRAAVEVREGVLRCLHPPWKGDLPQTQSWGPKGCVLPIPSHPVLPILWATMCSVPPSPLRSHTRSPRRPAFP